MTYSHNLSREIYIFQEWMNQMESKPGINSPEEAYAAVRAVLQTIRDRLTINDASHLSAQLPVIARGIFYEGWKPSSVPQTYDLQEFYDRVRHRLAGNCANADPGLIARHVFEIMAEHMDEGQMRHLQGCLPQEFRRLMPELVPA